jgi:CBS domain-containing protein
VRRTDGAVTAEVQDRCMTIDLPAQAGSYLAPSFQHARVADAMRPRVLTCDAGEPLVDVARRMTGEHVHSIVVLRGGDPRAWTIVTDRDVLRCAERLEEMAAGDAASGEPLTVTAGEWLRDAARTMAQHDTSHAVVLDEPGGRPVGMLSTLDIAGVLAWGRG